MVESRVELPGFWSPQDPARKLRFGRHELSREEVSDIQKARLVDAFVLIVAEDGYESAGVRSTCKRAGVSFNTFYEYFQTIEDLFLEAFDSGVDMIFHEAEQAYFLAESWESGIEASISRFLEVLADNPTYSKFFAVESRKVGSVGRDRVDEKLQNSFRLMIGALPTSGLDIELETLAQMVIGGLFMPVYFRIRSGDYERLQSLAPQMMQFMTGLFGGAGSPGRPRRR